MAAPAYKSSTTATVSTGNAAFSIAAPAGVASGDYQIVALVYASSSGDVGATPAGWTLLDNTAMTLPSGDTGRVAIYESTTAVGAFSMTMTSARVWAAIRAAYTLPAGSSGRVKALGKTIETPTGGTSHTTPSVSTTAVDSLVLVWGGVDTANTSQAWTGVGAGWTQREAIQGGNASERQAVVLADRTYAAATSGITTTLTSAVADEAGMYAIVLEGVSSATAPTVDAGADVASHAVNTVFSRTAGETDNGAAITSRAWTIQSGPTGVGSTIGTAAALSWTPTQTGVYVLRYSATNSAGTGNDDVQVTVTATAATSRPLGGRRRRFRPFLVR